MPAKFEQFDNNIADDLNGAINAVVTSVTVTDGSKFPSDGNFHIKVENEIMLVTARATNVFTVIRGREGTAGAVHADAVVVTLFFTTQSIRSFAADHANFYLDEGIPGPLGSFTDTNGNVLTSSSFAWINQGTSTVSDLANNSAIRMRAQTGTGANIRLLKRAAPSTPYTIYAAFAPVLSQIGTNITHCGFCWREISSGNLKVIALARHIIGADDRPHQLNYGQYTNPTTFATWDSPDGLDEIWNWNDRLTWMFITDDGTNRSWGISMNGLKFQILDSELRGANFTTAPDEVGFYMNVNDATRQQALNVLHWSEQ